MTWDELKEKAKEFGYEYQEYINNGKTESLLEKRIDYAEYLVFYKGGKIDVVSLGKFEINVAIGRTQEQMLMIMEALK